MKKALSVFLILMLLVTIPSKGLLLKANAIDYDASAAISYAKSHCTSDKNNGYCPNGWLCSSFVSACLRAGGIDVNEAIVVNLKNAIEGYGTIYPLKVTNGKISMYGDNAGKISPGDVVFNYCNNCTSYGKAPYRHVVFCTGEDSNGYMKDCAHNSLHNDSTFGASWSCDGCGSNNWTHYVCHINGTPTPDIHPVIHDDKNIVNVFEQITFWYSGLTICEKAVFHFMKDGEVYYSPDSTSSTTLSTYFENPGFYQIYASGLYKGVWYDSDKITVQVVNAKLETDKSLVRRNEQIQFHYSGLQLTEQVLLVFSKNGNEYYTADVTDNAFHKNYFINSGTYIVYIKYMYQGTWGKTNSVTITVKDEYTVSFNSNGGTCTTDSKIVYSHSTYEDLPTPTRVGYSFTGWYTDSDGGTIITSDTNVTITSSQTLYAHWEKIFKLGDTDGDGDIGLKDVVQITRYLAGGWDVTVDLTTADVNKDGEVNLKDAVLLRRYLAGGWGVQLA